MLNHIKNAAKWCTYLYPLFVYALMDKVPSFVLVMVALLLLLFRTNSLRGVQLFDGLQSVIILMLVFFAPIFIGLSLWQPKLGVLIYPVMMNFIMAILFATTLRKGPPFIERIAVIRKEILNVDARFYLRKLTLAWSLFCLANGLVALATVLSGNMYIWMLYNGIFSYILIGVFLIGERLFRNVFKTYILKKKAIVL